MRSMSFLVLTVFTIINICTISNLAQVQLPGFYRSQYFNEQVVTFNYYPEVRIQINAPAAEKFRAGNPTIVALFALPNGNTIEQTIGKKLKAGDDWHFDIQHIGAQTRFIREKDTTKNYVTVYLETTQKSWPTWRGKYVNNAVIIKAIVDTLKLIFNAYNPAITLTGHSGGGSFTFGYLNSVTAIPDFISRISFLDSDYNYDDTYGAKFVPWLNASNQHFLSVIAYNDSVALLNGQPIVSPTGGTWYRSKMMAAYLSNYFTISSTNDTNFLTYSTAGHRINFILKHNPRREILHTVQVERNGFIQGTFSGTSFEGAGYVYYGSRAYTQWIQTELPGFLRIPPRNSSAKTGSEFMNYVMNMSVAERESAILQELNSGNVPNFMRTLTKLQSTFQDVNGASHSVIYEVMPDYLCIGSDSNFCRIPMGPITAQKVANLYGAVLPTPKLVYDIYIKAGLKLEPITYTPVGNQNELVPKFIEHNTAIEAQRIASGKPLGTLIGGIKKDVVLSNLIVDPTRPGHVCIYGWHRLTGVPIQPLTNIHINTYVDYSHGIRFLNGELLIDSVVYSIKSVLMNSTMYKILSNESAPMPQASYLVDSTIPGQPRTFNINSIDSTSLYINIKSDLSVVNYSIYYGDDGVNFTNVISLPRDSVRLSGLQANHLYFIKTKANNDAGSSAFSEVLAASTSTSIRKCLIVNGFDRATGGNTYNYVRFNAPELNNLKFKVSSCTNDAILEGMVNLGDYDFIIYILGEESTADETFSSSEQNYIKSYLNSGGKLFVTGAEIAWDLDYKGSAADKDFCYNYLKMQYVADAPNGAAGTVYQASTIIPPFMNVPTINYDNGTHGTYNVNYPDVIKPVNGSTGFMTYYSVAPATGYAGITFDGNFPLGTNPGKLIVIGFPFETIYTADIRQQLMNSVTQFFGYPTNVSEQKPQIANSFQLYQNYPNPFNGQAIIQFDIPERSEVKLNIYDVQGCLVQNIVSGSLNTGNYRYDIDLNHCSSGVYFAELQANNFNKRMKMILLK